MNIKSDPRKLKETDSSEDDLYAMLAVLSQGDEGSDACPSAMDLADFSNGRLRGRKRKKIMAHLNECALCRRQWIRLGAATDAVKDRKPSRFPLLMDKLKNINFGYTLVGSGCGVALATCLLLFIYVSGQNSLNNMILNSYAGLSPAQVAHFNSFASKGETQKLKEPSSKAMAAYRQGLTAAKNSLSSNADPLPRIDYKDKGQNLFAALGQWVVLLQCACLSSEAVSDSFWADQQAISAKIQNELQNIDNRKAQTLEVMAAVTAIQKAIERIGKTGNNYIGCGDINFAINNLESMLGSS